MDGFVKAAVESMNMTYAAGTAVFAFIAYRLLLFLWELRKKRNELKNEMDEYVNSLIDIKLRPVADDADRAHRRINELDKLQLPVTLTAIETKLGILASSVDAGFKRIEEDIRSFYRKGGL